MDSKEVYTPVAGPSRMVMSQKIPGYVSTAFALLNMPEPKK